MKKRFFTVMAMMIASTCVLAGCGNHDKSDSRADNKDTDRVSEEVVDEKAVDENVEQEFIYPDYEIGDLFYGGDLKFMHNYDNSKVPQWYGVIVAIEPNPIGFPSGVDGGLAKER